MTQYSGVYTLQTQGQALTSGQWCTDPYYKNTTLLLHADGVSGGAQNNTFLDSSTNGFPITRNGNTTQGSFTPYGPTWSNYFDGTVSTQLYVANNAAFALPGDFTIEAWVNFNSNTTSVICGNINSSGYGEWAFFYSNTAGLRFITDDAATVITGAYTVTVGKWTHFAISRSGTSVRLFADGVLLSTTTNSSSNAFTGTMYLGITNDNGLRFPGYLSNLRIVKGQAVYTSAFTPSTAPLTTTSQGVTASNVSLLTCQSNRCIDNSNNQFAVSNYNVSVQRFSPFAPQYQYTPAVIGGSGYFDGSGDYLSTGSSTNLQPASSDFCVEAWVYPTTVDGTSRYIYQANDNSTGTNLEFRMFSSSSGVYAYYYATSGYLSQLTSATPLVANQWSHVAWSRSSTTVSLFVNGTRVATGSISGGSSASTAYVYVGQNLTSGGGNFLGYINDVRFVKGSSVYTPSSTTLTVPTAPLTAVTNTQFLLSYTNAGIYDNAMMNNLETVGNAQVSTSVVKYGSGSLAFDGTGDYLTIANNPNLQFGTGDFTIEAWVYPTSAVYGNIASKGNYSPGGVAGYFEFRTTDTSKLQFYDGNTDSSVTSSASVPLNTWTHVVVSRSGSIIRLFVNGIADSTLTDAGAFNNTGVFAIGAAYQSGYTNLFYGYIDDFRITKGVARYTANFQPPKVAFANQ